jgi:hypothetical protein
VVLIVDQKEERGNSSTKYSDDFGETQAGRPLEPTSWTLLEQSGD